MKFQIHLCDEAVGRTDNICAPLGINEQILALSHIVDIDLGSSVDLGEKIGRREKLQRVPQAHLHPMFGDLVQCRLRNAQTLDPGSNPDNHLHFFGRVWAGGYDEKAGKEIGRYAVCGYQLIGSPNRTPPTIRR